MRTHTKTFHIRFTETEYDRLCKYAAKAGLPKTTYIRHMINGCCPREKPPAEYWILIRGVHKLGNNLNQLIFQAHRFGSLHIAKVEELKKQVNCLVLAILDKLYVPEEMDVPTTLERGRQLAEAEQIEEGEFHAK